MTTPCWSPFATTPREISPRFAYIRMLRATSEMAAAMTVWSPVENPAPAASSRPCWRACTTSTSDAISTRSWSATLDASTFALLVEPPLGVLVEKGEALFQVEGRRDALESQPELHHREGDLRLDAHDHRFRARGVIVDVTALDVMDSFAVRTLRDIAHMARLRGAETVIVGIQPDVAFAMVQLGLTLKGVATVLDLEEGLAFLNRRTEERTLETKPKRPSARG